MADPLYGINRASLSLPAQRLPSSGSLELGPLACHAIRTTSRGPTSPCPAPLPPCLEKLQGEVLWCETRPSVESLLTIC
jgi:hypothetical protein